MAARKVAAETDHQENVVWAAQFEAKQTYNAATSTVPEDLFNLVLKCMNEFYENYSGDKVFDNSLTVKAMAWANNGSPSRIRGSYFINPSFTRRKDEQWVEVLLDKKLPYVMYFSTGKLAEPGPDQTKNFQVKYYTPMAAWHKPEDVYSPADLARIEEFPPDGMAYASSCLRGLWVLITLSCKMFFDHQM